MNDTVRFPDIPLYQGWGAPHRLESEAIDMEVIAGEIPRELSGTLYRCGPDRQYPPRTQDDIFIDGEGMAHLFRIDSGHIDYRCRWVRNERFLLQQRAHRSLFGRYRNRYTNDPSVAGKGMGTANTNIVWHGRRLLVLKEDSLPIEVHPETLATLGEWNFAGKVHSVSITAHPKLDLKRNELLMFSYQARGDCTRDFAYYIADASGAIVHETWFEMPYPGMVHDFAVSESHIVVPFFPLITDMTVLKAGGPFYRWYPAEHSYYAVLPRRGSHADVRWFRGPTVSAGHMMNAVTAGNEVHLDLCLYQGNCFDFFPSADGSPFKPAPPLLTRLTFNLATEAMSSRVLLPASPAEMPKLDDRYMGRPYRYGYVICRPPDARTGTVGMSAIGRYDHESGTLTSWSPGDDSGVQEPVFVPRAPDAAEGDGYLLVLVNRLREMRSDLAILDASRLEQGPVALVRMPTRVRSTFHGMWVPSATLTSGLYS
ncbi:MAG TPA: carotenoid oxygenase family protein [Steroidobacteraceae bacterium]|nr:carotenoid oxygenase family protein [Steroidobacteraceae bacterium]